MTSHVAPAGPADLDDCLFCGRSVEFEVPSCADGHGEECPDRVCTACGVVVVIGPAPVELAASA